MSKSLSLSLFLPPTDQLKLLYSQKKSARTSSPSSSSSLPPFFHSSPSLCLATPRQHTQGHIHSQLLHSSPDIQHTCLSSLLVFTVSLKHSTIGMGAAMSSHSRRARGGSCCRVWHRRLTLLQLEQPGILQQAPCIIFCVPGSETGLALS